MGTCCNGNLIATLDNKTKIYYLPKSNLKRKKTYRVDLQGDIYKICPSKTALTETDQIFKRQPGLLTFLKDETGIKTGQHTIRIQFEKLLENNNIKKIKCENLVFQQPTVSDDNKEHLFKCLAGSIYSFDKGKSKHYLRNIYVPWKQLGIDTLRILMSEQVDHLTVLMPKD